MAEPTPKNNIDYIIWASNGDIYFIPKDRIEEFKLDKDSNTYQDIANDPIAKAMNLAAAYIDDNGDWQPFGATCIMAAYASQPDENQPQPGDKLAYINLDFDMNETFRKPHEE